MHYRVRYLLDFDLKLRSGQGWAETRPNLLPCELAKEVVVICSWSEAVKSTRGLFATCLPGSAYIAILCIYSVRYKNKFAKLV